MRSGFIDSGHEAWSSDTNLTTHNGDGLRLCFLGKLAIRDAPPDGVLWVLRSGAHWHDLPERYGKWKSVHTRFSRWAKAGVWERVFEALTKDRDNQYLMLDTTLVRAHQQAATGKGGAKIRLWGVPEED